jgi:hypothetical protein
METTINESVDELIAGAPLEQAPREVILECARRYIDGLAKLQQRAASRSRESMAKFEMDKTKAKQRLRAKANLITTELAQTLHREWSAALLAGEFALPDGTRVTWAEATAEQHGLRADQLEGLAAGDLATAAIHRQAINDLRSAGVVTLGDLS